MHKCGSNLPPKVQVLHEIRLLIEKVDENNINIKFVI